MKPEPVQQAVKVCLASRVLLIHQLQLVAGVNIKVKKLPVDTDEDGMPDEWEKKNGLNATDANDRNKVGADGFTMLEKYLNELAIIK